MQDGKTLRWRATKLFECEHSSNSTQPNFWAGFAAASRVRVARHAEQKQCRCGVTSSVDKLGFVNETGPVGFSDSSLELAVENEDVERVKTALAAGADANAVGSIFGQRLWTTAFDNESDEIVRAFVTAGADLDCVDTTGRPFLLALAARGESSAQLKRLLDLGAATSAVDTDGWTALHVVASYGYFISASLLLERGADRHAQTKNGKTPLDFASINGHSRVLKLLLG